MRHPPPSLKFGLAGKALKLLTIFPHFSVSYNYHQNLSIIKSSLLYSRLYKYADLEATLKTLQAPDNLKEFILSLPKEYQGHAVGQVKKNPNITISDLEAYLQKIKNKEQLKQNTDIEITKEIPEAYKYMAGWIIRQIKKYPEFKEELLNNLGNIGKFVDDYDINLESYNIKDLFELMEENSGLSFYRGRKGQATSFQNFFDQIQQQTYSALVRAGFMGSKNLNHWGMRTFLKIISEWRKNIENYLRKTGKSFDQVLEEGKGIMEAQQRGEFRGQEIPSTPLHNPEHNAFMTHLQEISDWYYGMIEDFDWHGNVNVNDENDKFNIFDYSLSDALEASNKWHEEQAEQGKGKKYDTINSSNIVYGPDNWKDESNKGYFILELKSDNDLKVEGFLMEHCVGGYCDQLKDGQTRIFSLRHNSDPYKPILTIETDPSGMVIRQDYGRKNSRVDEKFHQMVSEWNENYTSGKEIDFGTLNGDDIYRLIYNSKENDLLIDKYINYIEKSPADKIDFNTLVQIANDNKLSNDQNEIIISNILEKFPNSYGLSNLMEGLIDDNKLNKNNIINIINRLIIKDRPIKLAGESFIHKIFRHFGSDQEIFGSLKKLIDTFNLSEFKKILIAYDPSTDKEKLNEIILNEHNYYLINSAIRNPNVSHDLLNKLIEREVRRDAPLTEVYLSVLKNPKCNDELIEEILYKFGLDYQSSLPFSILEAILDCKNISYNLLTKIYYKYKNDNEAYIGTGLIEKFEKLINNKFNEVFPHSENKTASINNKNLLSKIQSAKDLLKKDPTFISMCKDFKVKPNIVDLIPMRFGPIDVSAKTVKGIIILNNKLLQNDNFTNNLHYLIHEINHFLTMQNRPTQSANQGTYLDNKDEIDAFKYQIEHIDDIFGSNQAEKYINHLLDHHEVDDIDWDDKKEELSERI